MCTCLVRISIGSTMDMTLKNCQYSDDAPILELGIRKISRILSADGNLLSLCPNNEIISVKWSTIVRHFHVFTSRQNQHLNSMATDFLLRLIAPELIINDWSRFLDITDAMTMFSLFILCLKANGTWAGQYNGGGHWSLIRWAINQLNYVKEWAE